MNNRRKWYSILLVGLVLLLALAGCPSTGHTNFPPPEGYDSWEEYENRNSITPSKTPPPETKEPEFIEVPLTYEIVDTYVKEDTVTHKSSIDIGGIGSAEDTWEETIFVACVEVENTDTVSGTFSVQFSIAEPTFGELTLSKKLELEPGEIGLAECPADELGDWSFEVIPSTKIVEQS